MTILAMEYKTVFGGAESGATIGSNGSRKLVLYSVARTRSRPTNRFCRHCGGKNVFVGITLMALVLIVGVVTQQQVELHYMKQEVSLLSEQVEDLLSVMLIDNQLDIQAYKQGEKLHKKNKEQKQDEKIRSHDKRDTLGCECPSEKPHFYIHGANDIEPGRTFYWEMGNKTYRRNNCQDSFHADKKQTSVGEKIQSMYVKYSGLYFVFAKLNVAGRLDSNTNYPAVGFSIKTKNPQGIVKEVGSALITQDGRGARYMDLPGVSYPVDTVQFSGLVKLGRDDEIYVRRLDHLLNSRDQFKHDDQYAHFGAFMISGTCA